MTTVVSVSGSIKSAYILWHLASTTSDELTAVFVDLKYYGKFGNNKSVRTGSKQNALDVIEWINANVRPIKSLVLTLDNFEPEYSGIPYFELIKYSTENNVSSLILDQAIDSYDDNDVKLRRYSASLDTNNIIKYPLIDNNKTTIDCIKETPVDLQNLCYKSSYYNGIAKMIDENLSYEEILINIQNLFGIGPSPDKKYVDRDGTIFVSSYYFNVYEFDFPLINFYPHLFFLKRL
jgi:hypothetical protein